jgi:hypothetical protein
MKNNSNETAQLIGENKTEQPFDGIPQIYEALFFENFGCSLYNYLTVEQAFTFFGKISMLLSEYQNGGHEKELITIQAIRDRDEMAFGCGFIREKDLKKRGYDLKGKRKGDNVFLNFRNNYPRLHGSFSFGRLYPKKTPLIDDVIDCVSSKCGETDKDVVRDAIIKSLSDDIKP